MKRCFWADSCTCPVLQILYSKAWYHNRPAPVPATQAFQAFKGTNRVELISCTVFNHQIFIMCVCICVCVCVVYTCVYLYYNLKDKFEL